MRAVRAASPHWNPDRASPRCWYLKAATRKGLSHPTQSRGFCSPSGSKEKPLKPFKKINIKKYPKLSFCSPVGPGRLGRGHGCYSPEQRT